MAQDPENVTGFENQVLVHIRVEKEKLFLYPKRATDTVLYHKSDKNPGKPDPAKPHEVRWIVSGLQDNQEVRIEVPNGGSVFGQTEFPIPGGYNSIRSGEAKDGPSGPATELMLKYDIVLENKGGGELDRIDPIIIIKDDP